MTFMRGSIACPDSVAFIGNAALGRWFGVDPRSAEMPWASPYNSMGSNLISFIDPDGENPLLIGALIGLTANGIGNLFSGENFFKGGFDAAFFGAAGGMISAGIGEVAQSFAGSWSNLGVSSFQAGAHGLSGGGLSAMQGGDFWHGAAAGFISSSVSSGIAALNGNGVMQMGGAALSGGISAEIAGGDFWRGAGVGGTVAGLNHLHTSYKRYLFERYDGIEHPGVLNLKNAGRSKVAVHLLKGIKHHMINGTAIDLNGLFDCLSSECLGIGGTHLLSRVNQGAINSFFGPSGDLFASFSIGDRNVKMMYEIPFHGSSKGLVFPHHNYQTKTFENGHWGIRWGGTGGLFLNFRNQTKFMSNWIFGR